MAGFGFFDTVCRQHAYGIDAQFIELRIHYSFLFDHIEFSRKAAKAQRFKKIFCFFPSAGFAALREKVFKLSRFVFCPSDFFDNLGNEE
jgi:hypothetical protein